MLGTEQNSRREAASSASANQQESRILMLQGLQYVQIAEPKGIEFSRMKLAGESLRPDGILVSNCI